MMQKTTKKCKNPDCGRDFKIYRSTDKYCSAKCFNATVDKGIQKLNKVKPISDKRLAEMKIYAVERKEYLALPENKICKVDGCNRIANSIEHRAGRRGYADQWAKDNNISLYIDKRFWMPVCLQHNLEFENNPELSKKYQLSKITGKQKQ